MELTLFLTLLFVLIVNSFQVRGTQSTSFIGILRKRSMNCVEIGTSNIHLDLSLRHNTWRISLSDKVIIINTVESPCAETSLKGEWSLKGCLTETRIYSGVEGPLE